MDHVPHFQTMRRAPADRPLLGQTILVVEDSRHAGETMRLMCLRGGARVRRADCVRSAERHLVSYRPSGVVVDLGLPDGSGLDLIGRLSRATPRVEVLIAVSGDPTLRQSALDAGADEFLEKPFPSIAAFQAAILCHLPPETLPHGPRLVPDDMIEPDAAALHDDLAHVAALIDPAAEPRTLAYAAAFSYSLARSVGDTELEGGAAALSEALVAEPPCHVAILRLSGLVRTRLIGGRVAV